MRATVLVYPPGAGTPEPSPSVVSGNSPETLVISGLLQENKGETEAWRDKVILSERAGLQT